MPFTFKVNDISAAPVQLEPFRGHAWGRQSSTPLLPDNHPLRKNKTFRGESCTEILQESSWDPAQTISYRNGFVDTAVTAYNQHHNLVIRPDDVWIALTAQFSAYVNAHAEELRKYFVAHDGKKELIAIQMGTLRTADYGALAQQMVDRLHENVNDEELAEWLLPRFSTTTVNDKIVGSITFMAAMQRYFDYKIMLLCGLPEVTLLGEVSDWELIRARVERLRKYDETLIKWADMLTPVLDHFVQTARGQPDLTWWNRICSNHGGGSGPRYLSGWITTFCAFNSTGKWQATTFTVPGTDKQSQFPIINTNDVPSGYVHVPVKIDDNGTEHDSIFFAGHMAAERVDMLTIAPKLMWAVALKNPVGNADAHVGLVQSRAAARPRAKAIDTGRETCLCEGDV